MCKLQSLKKNFFQKEKFFNILSVLLFAFGIIIYVPWNVYFGNVTEFPFIFSDFIKPCLYCFLLFVLTIGILCLSFPVRISEFFSSLLGGFGICVYLQTMFMNLHLGMMDGSEPVWSDHLLFAWINVIIWIFVLAASFAPYFLKVSWWKKVVPCVCFILFLLELTAVIQLVSLAPNAAWKRLNRFHLTAEKQFQFSKERNILVIIFDQFGGALAEKLIDANPELKTQLKDFTFYAEARGNYSSTFPALIHEVTGTFVPSAENQNALFNAMWNSPSAKSFYQQLFKMNYDCRFYVNCPIETGKPEFFHQYFSNFCEEKVITTIDYKRLSKCLMQMSGFSSAPYLLKRFFFYGDTFAADVVALSYEGRDSAPLVIPDRNDTYFSALQKNGLSTDSEKPVFAWHYTRGVHNLRCFDEKCRRLPDKQPSDIVVAGKACFFLLNELIAKLKEQGIYDQTAIIVTSDHCSRTEGFLKAGNDVSLFIKAFNEHHDTLQKNQKKYASIDLLPSILEIVGSSESVLKDFAGLQLSKIPDNRTMMLYHLFTHPELPTYRDVNGIAMPSNAFRCYSYDWAPKFDWNKFQRNLPLSSEPVKDENLLKIKYTK